MDDVRYLAHRYYTKAIEQNRLCLQMDSVIPMAHNIIIIPTIFYLWFIYLHIIIIVEHRYMLYEYNIK
jgi:hypothetical protein